eukprot:TRINITY_DN12414_c1_g1_i1.p1 TRINITY_DN12414_c1_g1~~TRINITY_DN12414_c1_g1_i1.p1  ORF type:complete len:335 (+),score=49.16 TRINITY_DN12414_c1_g1_i1:40-1044(+)
MRQNLRSLYSSPHLLHPPPPPPPPPPPQTHPTPTSITPPFLKHNHKLRRRDLAIHGSSALLFLSTPYTVDPFQFSESQAEEDPTVPATSDIDKQEQNSTTTNSCDNRIITNRAFFDVSIDGDPTGRIIVGLYGNEVPAGVARFAGLISGAAGISYRRKEFVKIVPGYIQHGGVRSYGVDAELAKKTGSDLVVDSLVEEWDREKGRCAGIKCLAGTVGIVVRDPSRPPPKIKLVARGGKIEIDEEEVGVQPNGTEFVIITRDSPELDESTVVIGRVLDGMDVVEKISKVKTVQENTGSPYFRVAKLIGDKRAVVAERGFNRPYSKVIVANCGLIN